MYFYIPNPKAGRIQGLRSDHLFTMRVREGEKHSCTDLNGLIAEILITKVDKRQRLVEYNLENYTNYTRPQKRILFQAIPDKLYLDKLIEILPLSEFSDLFLFESNRSKQYTVNQDRIKNILIRSCEQSQNAYMPTIRHINQGEIVPLLKEFRPVWLDCGSQSIGTSIQTIHALVGPEGGFDNEEVALFSSLALQSVSMGPIVYPSWVAGFAWYQLSRNGLTKAIL